MSVQISSVEFCLAASIVVALSALLITNNAYAQLSSGGARRDFGGEGRGLYYGGQSIPNIVLYSVLVSIIGAILYTVLGIARNSTKRSSKASPSTDKTSRPHGHSKR